MAISLDVIDVSEALERADGDEELLCGLVGLFLEESPSMLADIKGTVAQRDTKALEYAARTLKGSVGNFGAKNVYEAAFVLELSGTEAALPAPEKSVQELEPILSSLRMEMAAYALSYVAHFVLTSLWSTGSRRFPCDVKGIARLEGNPSKPLSLCP